MPVAVDIQIVNYRSLEYLQACLKSLFKQTQTSDITPHVFVADNNSGDDLSSIKKLYPHVTIQYLSTNHGFGAGHNFLAQQGHNPYLVILNPDIIFTEKDTLHRLIESLNQTQVAAIGPQLITTQGSIQAWDHGELLGLLPWFAQKLGSSYWRMQTKPISAAWISGACLLIKREAFEKVSGFDENFFLYKEDDDLGLRLRQAGYQLLYNPSVKVQHTGSVIASEQKYMYRSERLFINKHCRGFWRLLAHLRLTIQAYIHHYQIKP